MEETGKRKYRARPTTKTLSWMLAVCRGKRYPHIGTII